MTFLGFLASQMGAPIFDWGRTLATYLGGHMVMGYVLFFLGGVLLAVFYVTVLMDRLPGHSWERGLFFAVMMWIVTGAIFAPVLNMGFFMGGVLMAMGTLVTYMVYGATLGLLYDPK